MLAGVACGSDSDSLPDARLVADAALVADAPESSVLDATVFDVSALDANALDANALDGLVLDGSPSDLRTTKLYSPDGRVVTVIELDFCLMSPTTAAGGRCPGTYAEGLAKAKSATMDAGLPFYYTRAGRCAEGSYKYIPITDGLDGQVCYYSADQQLVGDLYFTDVMGECSPGSGTAAYAYAHGQIPPCTSVVWEVGNWLAALP